MSEKPRVLNRRIHGIPKGAVYVGRPSKWGNPYVMRAERDRQEVIEKYDRWLQTRPELLAALPELRGKDLVCYCAPRGCHADVLLRMANEVIEND